MAAHLQLLFALLQVAAGLVRAAHTRPLLLNASGELGLGVGQSYDQGQRHRFRQRGNWENNKWPLKDYLTDDWASSLGSKSICSEVTLLTAPGVLCNIEGAAPYLMAARFAGNLLQQGSKAASGSTIDGQTSGDANQRRSYSTDEHTSWMVADYVISQGVSQAGVGIIRKLHGEAQVDMFLCTDANCNVIADIQTIIPYNNSSPSSQMPPDDGSWCKDAPSKCQGVGDEGGEGKQSPRRAVLFTRLHIGERLAVPVAITRDIPRPSYARRLSKTNRDDATVHELVWGESSANWDGDDQAMMPVGTLVRLALWGETEQLQRSNELATPAKGGDGFEVLHYGTYRVYDPWANETFCTIIVVPSSVWYDEHGWNASHPDHSCSSVGTDATRGAFVYDGYFRQSVFVDERTKVVGRVSNTKEYIPGLYAPESVTFGARDSDVHGLLFDPEPSASIGFPGQLQLNKTALRLYGYHLGLTVRPLQSTTVNMPFNGRYGFSSWASANCTWPACRTLVVGSAVIVAWDAGLDWKQAILDEDITPMFEALLKVETLSAGFLPAWQADCTKWVRLGPYPFVPVCWCRHGHNGTICRDNGNDPPFACMEIDDLCSKAWDPNESWPLPQNGKSQGPPTQPLHAALGDVYWRPIDNSSRSHCDCGPFLTGGRLHPGNVDVAIENLLEAASNLLDKQLNLALVGADSTRGLTGAVLDATVVVVAAIALATSYRDLDAWISSKVGRAMACVKHNASVTRFSRVITCFVIALSLVIAPAVTLRAELVARYGNPPEKGEHAGTGWLSTSTGDGTGPYHVVAVVSVTIASRYNMFAFVLVITNLLVSGAITCWLWVLLYRHSHEIVKPAAQNEPKVVM